MLLPYIDKFLLRLVDGSRDVRPPVRLPCCVRISSEKGKICKACKPLRLKRRMSIFYTLHQDARDCLVSTFLQYQFLATTFTMLTAKNPHTILAPTERITFSRVPPVDWDWELLENLDLELRKDVDLERFHAVHVFFRKL
jgi:hypothetical protein